MTDAADELTDPERPSIIPPHRFEFVLTAPEPVELFKKQSAIGPGAEKTKAVQPNVASHASVQFSQLYAGK